MYRYIMNQRPKQKKSETKKVSTSQSTSSQNEEGNALTFAQSLGLVAGTNGRVITKIKCFKCNQYSHYADQCPIIDNNNEQHHDTRESAGESEEEVQNKVLQHMQETHDVTSESENNSVIVSFIHTMKNSKDDETNKNTKIPSLDILLDTWSTCSAFNNKKMLINIRSTKKLVAQMNLSRNF